MARPDRVTALSIMFVEVARSSRAMTCVNVSADWYQTILGSRPEDDEGGTGT